MHLPTSIGIVLVTAAAAVTCASADGPQVGSTVQTVFSPDGRRLYVASPAPHARTHVHVQRRSRRLRTVRLRGRLGFPIVAADGSSEGVSRDGETLVLSSLQGRFAVLHAHPLRSRYVIQLRRTFSYDALSPHARTLYLIQHVRSPFSNRYYVRAYDLVRRHLLKRPIFDRREKWSVMSGLPVTRATSSNGRWVYTLYSRPGGKPFVHSLDSVHRVAVCVDLPWMRDQNRLFEMQLRLSRDDRKLALRRGHRIVWTMNTRTFRTGRPR